MSIGWRKTEESKYSPCQSLWRIGTSTLGYSPVSFTHPICSRNLAFLMSGLRRSVSEAPRIEEQLWQMWVAVLYHWAFIQGWKFNINRQNQDDERFISMSYVSWISGLFTKGLFWFYHHFSWLSSKPILAGNECLQLRSSVLVKKSTMLIQVQKICGASHKNGNGLSQRYSYLEWEIIRV